MSYKLVQYTFFLLLILIVVAYAAGARTTISALKDAGVQFMYAVTGRRTDGSFAPGVGA